jgi:hypothetical protein
MNRRLERDEREHVGRLHVKGAARSAPRLKTREKLAEKLHRSLGCSRASLDSVAPALRGQSDWMPAR